MPLLTLVILPLAAWLITFPSTLADIYAEPKSFIRASFRGPWRLFHSMMSHILGRRYATEVRFFGTPKAVPAEAEPGIAPPFQLKI